MIVKSLPVLLLVPLMTNATCFEEVSNKYLINSDLLKAITLTESTFNHHAVNCANRNGSCDYGFAQINLSEWKHKLDEFNISIIDLQDPCQNLHFAGWILAKNFKQYGRSWHTVSIYNVGTSKNKQSARDRYIAKVKENLAIIQKIEKEPKR